MHPFNFSVPTTVAFGIGRRHDLLAIVAGHRWRRVGFVVDQNLRNVPAVTELIDAAREGSDEAVVAWSAAFEPTYEALDQRRLDFADRDLDVIVGIGGGSTIDTAKAMAALVHNQRPAIEYRGFDRLTERVLPIVAVPTTAGTGSEVTPNASFVDVREQRKMGINGEAVRPRYALLDPELTITCPVLPTVSAAADSLVHATEAFVARKTNAMARMLAREGFARVFNNLPLVVEEPANLACRTEVMFGAFAAGLALMHSGTGPAAAMSYPLGVRHGVPHGIAGAVFLPRVAVLNIERGVCDYAELYEVMAGADRTQPRKWQAQAFVNQLLALWTRVGIPDDLGFCGVTETHLDALVRNTLDLKDALEQNPVAFGESEVRDVFMSLSLSEAAQ